MPEPTTTEPGAQGTQAPQTGANTTEDPKGSNAPQAGATTDTRPGASADGATQGAQTNQQDVDESNWDEKTKSYIKKLRDENAARRKKTTDLENQVQNLQKSFDGVKKAIGLEDNSDLTPEQQVEVLTEHSQGLELSNQLLRSAIGKGINSEDGLEYFEFLVGKQLESLGEGEELTDEMLDGISAKVKRLHPGQQAGGVSTSVGTETGSTTPKPGQAVGVTVEQFAKMTVSEKSELYSKSPEQYKQLLDEAKTKRLLI